MRRVCLPILAMAFLCGSALFAQTSYILIPYIAPGVMETKVELARTDLTLNNVQATYVAPGQSSLDQTPTTLKAYVGPSTAKGSPLLNLSSILPGNGTGGGMVILDPVAGLQTIEVSFEVEEAPSRTAWKLPLLAITDFFAANSTAYVLNLIKGTDASSNLQIYNAGNLETTCTATVLRPKGSTIEQRTGLKVPALGVLLVSDILRQVGVATGSGINVGVSCDMPFYALGTYPSTNRWNSAVQYPSEHLPAPLTAVTLYDMPGRFFHVTQGNGLLDLPLNLDPDIAYRTVTFDFEADIALPRGQVFFEALLGLSRKGGRRFGKTLFFGNFYKYSENKMVIDEGTPFIETDVKRTFNLVQGHTYHWTVTVDNLLQSIHYVINNADGTNVTDIYTGLYNNFNVVNGNQPAFDIGLPGVADNAYFPPVGWSFSNLLIVATH
jgi:hypothetical protein